VLESEGLATVQLSAIRDHSERIHPPRALYCEFPLGRPLGKPNDPAFQRRVLLAAFALLERPAVPVLEDFPEVVAAEPDELLACALPPRLDEGEAPAVGEARGLRAAYERQLARAGRTSVGMVADADGIPDLVAAFVRVADGASADDAGFPSDPHRAAQDVRAYYEEAALALSDHVPSARAAESWIFRSTETGRILRTAQQRLVDAGRSDFLATVVARGQE
jgi:hypothetical protein